jgi:hypothetical protein
MRHSRIPAELEWLVRRRAENVCEYCRLPQEFQEAVFHIDHVRPVVRGGKTTAANLALACVSCSLRKAARVAARDPETGLVVHLFHPRRDAWCEHFEWVENWRVAGKSGKGRATVSALGMNFPRNVAIRADLAGRGLFPPPPGRLQGD